MIPDRQAVLGLLESGFRQLRVLVVGDLMLDRYILGEVDRISPEAPVPVLRHAQRLERAGGAANVAMNLVGLGCQVELAGFWGDDMEQRELATLLEAAGVGTSAVEKTKLPTISKTRIVGRQQQLLRLDIESQQEPSAADRKRLRERLDPLLNRVQAVVLSDYAKGVLSRELCEDLILHARAMSVPVLVDPKSPDFSKYNGATVVCPNLKELVAATVFGGGVTEAKELDLLLEMGEMQRREHDLKYLVVTMSERGMRVLSETGVYASAARSREVFDVSGAGDTVIATLAAGLAGKLAMNSAVELATLAAGIVVGKRGTAAIAAHELVSVLTPSTGVRSAEKLLTREQAMRRVEEWCAAGEVIVFTNGVFDLLHVGHVALLEECRGFGTKLVLGLNTDASVRRLKGDGRPVVGQQERARVMSALAAVDAVVLFGEDTPLELIKALCPDVLVKGGDYSVETVVGHEVVLGAGGRVEIVPLLEGHSTTNIIQALAGQVRDTAEQSGTTKGQR